jgi:aminopeptidase YwaD
MKKLFCLSVFGINCQMISAQFVEHAKPILEELCSAQYAGRGYVQDGVNKAADYLANQFEQIGLKHFNDSYFQNYSFDINTIQKVSCTIDGKIFEAGEHFLVDAPCPSIKGKFQLLPFDLANNLDMQLLFIKLQQGIMPNEAIVFKHAEDGRAVKKLVDSIDALGFALPLIIKSTSKKLLWTTSQRVDKIPMLTFPDTIINTKNEIEIIVENKLIKEYANKNLIGFIPGKKKNTKGYIVFTAHYDHLGMMGEKAFFPGASDNASGTSMLLSIAKYYKQNKVDYPVIFILFSGEEVGLLGSKYFVEHPLFDLSKVKMLMNIDIMGNAEEGITVVNGETFRPQFDQLAEINKQQNYLPQVKIRGKASNSDHYYFGEAGVPSIFIFSNGGVGYYHDVWDKPNTISLKNFDNVGKLLVQFANEIR